jgi:hypothetical protein
MATDFGIALNKVECRRRRADYTGDPIGADEARWAVEQAAMFIATVREKFLPGSSGAGGDRQAKT